MRVRTALRISVCLGCFFLAGCAWIIDEAAGFPASDVISDVKKTSDEIKEENHQERVEELNNEYDEFLRSQEAADNNKETEQQSVVIKQDRDPVE